MKSRAAFVLLVLAGCGGPAKVDNPLPLQAAVPTAHDQQTSEKRLDTSRSVVYWKGTKMMGAGYHEGLVRLQNGSLKMASGNIVAGEVVVNMMSIEVTDIPAHEPVPRRNLTNHLHQDFETKRFSAATFTIHRTEPESDSVMLVTGALKIRDVSRVLTVPVVTKNEGNHQRFEATFVINRHDWGIGATGSWLAQKLVDDDIELRLDLRTLK